MLSVMVDVLLLMLSTTKLDSDLVVLKVKKWQMLKFYSQI